MKPLSILFTGASSFTGYWFVRALALQGHRVVAPLRRTCGDYEALGGARAERVKLLAQYVAAVEDCPLGSTSFLQLCADEKFDLFCHHAAVVGDYKSAQFDVEAAVASNTHRLEEALMMLKTGGARAMLLTGSSFEAGMGEGTPPLDAFSPYAISKTRTAEIAAMLCQKLGLTFGRYIIPNVFGPLQEPRFYDHILQSWAKGETVTLTAPNLVRDHVPVDLLALFYVSYAEQVVEGAAPLLCLPSCYAEAMDKFAERLANEMRKRTDLACAFKQANKIQSFYAEPEKRINTMPARALTPKWREATFWDDLARYYFPNHLKN